MPEIEPSKKKQSWRFASLSSLRAAPRSFLCHPEPRAIGSFQHGEQLLAKQFIVAGEALSAANGSLWSLQPPSEKFLQDLHSFSWLDDLAAVGGGAARKQAQAWMLEWIEAFGQGTSIGWHPALAGRRVINWCSHAMFLLKGLSPKDSIAVFKSLGRQVNFLSNNWKATPQGLAKFQALTGMVYAGLSLEGCEYALRPALKGLADECHDWIGESGAIPSRNPEELSEIFTLLTWLSKLLEATGRAADPAISGALERIAPGLRALRFANGELARFHGGGTGAEGQLDQALADAGIRSAQPLSRFMGFERLSAGRLVVIMDGDRPPGTGAPHASPLGFELAIGRQPLLVNAGPSQASSWRGACAHAAAHNALTIEGKSPAPIAPDIKRAHDQTSVWLSAFSTGFEQSHGLHHERRLLIEASGQQFSGEDRIFPASSSTSETHPADLLLRPLRGETFMLHFHLHPDVAVKKEEDHCLGLTLPNGAHWVFRQEGGLTCLEDSIYLDHSPIAPRATKQIVVIGRTLDYVGAIRWSFTKA